MSEYQYVAFRAIETPVSAEDLEFMRTQSTRAEITPWSFDNEYHFGDFRGNAEEMLRRGYDIHMHYADFGIRRVLIRFPQGIPDKATADYRKATRIPFKTDKSGPGAILEINPYYDAGELDYLQADCGELVDSLAPLREEILSGDLRPLYLGHLALACDSNHDLDKTREMPVPAGLDDLTDAQIALANFFDLSGNLLAAAAQCSPPLAERDDSAKQAAAWVGSLKDAQKTAWLQRLLVEPQTTVRTEMLAEFRRRYPLPPWPVVEGTRTVTELYAIADDLSNKSKQKAEAAAAKQRIARLAAMRKDPDKTLRESEQLVEQRGRSSYKKCSELLAELREALEDSDQADLADQQALALRQKFPTLQALVAELRKQGFLPKK